jgi:hypothetical protein
MDVLRHESELRFDIVDQRESTQHRGRHGIGRIPHLFSESPRFRASRFPPSVQLDRKPRLCGAFRWSGRPDWNRDLQSPRLIRHRGASWGPCCGEDSPCARNGRRPEREVLRRTQPSSDARSSRYYAAPWNPGTQQLRSLPQPSLSTCGHRPARGAGHPPDSARSRSGGRPRASRSRNRFRCASRFRRRSGIP